MDEMADKSAVTDLDDGSMLGTIKEKAKGFDNRSDRHRSRTFSYTLMANGTIRYINSYQKLSSMAI